MGGQIGQGDTLGGRSKIFSVSEKETKKLRVFISSFNSFLPYV